MKRHKQPTFVSMWMLDVFCCALGCVTLLWLLKTREAAQSFQTTAIVRAELDESVKEGIKLKANLDETAKKLALVEKERDDQAKVLALVEKELDTTSKQLALAKTERDDTAKNLALIKTEMDKQAKDLALVRTEKDKNAKELAALMNKLDQSEANLLTMKDKTDDQIKSIVGLRDKLQGTEKKIAVLEEILKEKEKSRVEATGKMKELLGQVNDLKKEMAGSSTKTDSAMTKMQQLQSQLDDAKAMIIDLQGNKAKLADKINKLQTESELRFAGITLTGKRALFLVDMSGSMDRLDLNSPQPTKWPIVRESVLKVARSLPDLEKFQVIFFSNRLQYPMGQDGNWVDYHGERSLTDLGLAMSKVTPQGDTNLFMAFEEAFQYRSKGLDTIYLFSDGLPTSGQGLSPQQEVASIKETERSELLGKFLRKTIRDNWNRNDPRLPRIRIHSIGFFYESPDVGSFLWGLSRENDGSFVGMSKP
jgi:hypothetical protein